jgi:uncharacterized protein YecE (DUF72 family)
VKRVRGVHMIRVGTCAFTDHQGLYPPGLPAARRLGYYATQFTVVEIDVTFYRPLARATAVRWLAETPAGFVFDVKAPGSVTGHRPADAEELRRFHAFVEPLAEAGRLGAVLLQWPPRLRRTPDHEAVVVAAVRALQPWRLAVEWRHRSWYAEPDALFAWMRELGVAHVVVDGPDAGATSVPWVPVATRTDLAYVRFHGRNAATWNQRGLPSSQARFRYAYRPDELAARVPDLLELANAASDVHVLMNNNYGSYAVDGARWFRDRLAPVAGTQLGFSWS